MRLTVAGPRVVPQPMYRPRRGADASRLIWTSRADTSTLGELISSHADGEPDQASAEAGDHIAQVVNAKVDARKADREDERGGGERNGRRKRGIRRPSQYANSP